MSFRNNVEGYCIGSCLLSTGTRTLLEVLLVCLSNLPFFRIICTLSCSSSSSGTKSFGSLFTHASPNHSGLSSFHLHQFALTLLHLLPDRTPLLFVVRENFLLVTCRPTNSSSGKRKAFFSRSPLPCRTRCAPGRTSAQDRRLRSPFIPLPAPHGLSPPPEHVRLRQPKPCLWPRFARLVGSVCIRSTKGSSAGSVSQPRWRSFALASFLPFATTAACSGDSEARAPRRNGTRRQRGTRDTCTGLECPSPLPASASCASQAAPEG